jgi:eukaryotic-like serine/threonine-protein kinase
MGTPRYMAPEQVVGEVVDARSDLFAAGAILFEMLAGRPAFGGRTIVEILHATLHEQPPALTGSPVVAAVDRVIRRALAKQPGERPASADSMAEGLRAVRGVDTDDTPALPQTLTRLVVLPFRVLRPDAETDFLAFSLPDAISTSLSGIGSLIVRSSATAARFNEDAPDLKAVAAEADVDRVVMGSLLRIRFSAGCRRPAGSVGPTCTWIITFGSSARDDFLPSVFDNGTSGTESFSDFTVKMLS